MDPTIVGLWGGHRNSGRRKRPSVDLYSEICRSNAISFDVVAHFAPEILPKLFPD